MVDRVSIRIRIGSWMDVDDPGLVEVGGLEMFPMVDSADEFIRGVVDAARTADVNPWEHELRVKAYYANASGEGWDLAVSIAPYLDGAVTIEVVKLVAGAFLGAVIQNMLRVPSWLKKEQKRTLDEVTEQIRDFVVKRDNLAPTEISFVSTQELEDSSFELLVKRETDGHVLLVRTDADGAITGVVDVTEWMSYYQRAAERAGASDGGGPA